MKIFLKKLKDYLKYKTYLLFLHIISCIKSIGRQRKIDKYFKKNTTKKLHIGCGKKTRDGWLASDLNSGKGVIFLDATKKFPFRNDSLDYIFSEHMIEHIDYFDGKKMLQECYRVLRPGGKLRIATPDLKKYLSLIDEPENVENKKAINFYMKKLFSDYPNDANSPYHILNLLMHKWGHSYIYTLETLSEQLKLSGFKDIQVKETGKSDDSNLKNMEMHNENAIAVNLFDEDGFFKFETIIVEASI